MDEVHLIFYAYGSNYNLTIDLEAKNSFCEGLLEPVYRCPFNMKEAMQQFVTSAELNYNFFCQHEIKVHKYLISFTNINKCLIVQTGIHASTSKKIFYEFRGRAEVLLNFVSMPFFKTDDDFHEIPESEDFFNFTYGKEDFTSWKQTLQHSGQYTRYIVYMKMYHSRVQAYHTSVLAMKMQLNNAPAKCAFVNESTHKELSARTIPVLTLEVTSDCGVGTYSLPLIYEFTIKVSDKYEIGRFAKRLIYITLYRRYVCSNLTSSFDIFHVDLRKINNAYQSFFMNTSKLYIGEIHVGATFLYGKNDDSQCMETEIHYDRVEFKLYSKVTLLNVRISIIKV